MRAQVAEVNPVGGHPMAQGRPLSGSTIVPELANVRFLTWRKAGKRDIVRPLGSLPTAITTKGIDLEGRRLYDNVAGVQLFASFPPSFKWCGSSSQSLKRIGNSVPPLFMRAIARHIRGADERTPKMTYVESLEDAWRAHLAPREPDAPTVVSLFAGCGGSSLGYSMAGFRELLAVEWDDNAVATFRLNFPEVPVYHGDIAALSVDDACGLAGTTVGALDVLDGSPPCQGFSTAGKRDMDDDRNQLFREFCRLLAGLQPRAFVMENVSGMVKGKMRLIFVNVLRELKACGYRVSARLLNAMYFGVPQSRQRLIFVGVRDDLPGEPGHPRAENAPITLGEACANMAGNDIDPVVSTKHQYPKMIRTVQPGESLGKRYGKGFNWIRCDSHAPYPTISKSTTYGGLGFLFLPDGSRSLSARELARCHSLPDSYVLIGSYVDAVARIGNSVPPLFMRAIAMHLRETILTPELSLAT